MLDLINIYKNNEGIEKNLEKAFYLRKKIVEINNDNHKFIPCNECKELINTDHEWCQQCNSKYFQQNFSKWTSNNKYIDRFIQEAQLNAKNCYEVLEWIPYNKLSGINYYDKGGFSEIHKAIWSDGPIDNWNFDKQQWNRWNCHEVILKTLNNSSNLNSKFLYEWKNHYGCQAKLFSKFTQIFGISQNPVNLNYIMIMNYAEKGSLRKCLSDIVKFKWQDKLQLLRKIILGLKIIHESNLTHGDFHDGNILISDNYEIFISDLGLCKPIKNLHYKITNEIHGVLPFMAPEILRNEPYTLKSDIYSFSMIMWEFTSGIPPFNNKAHDYNLILDICEGERPKIIKNTPKCYIDLMNKCWDLEQKNRPTITELEYKITEWNKYINEDYMTNNEVEVGHNHHYHKIFDIDSELENDIHEFVKANNTLVQDNTLVQNDTLVQTQTNNPTLQPHSQAYYTSRNISKILNDTKSLYEYKI
ncbi:Ste20p [Rhizophagus irregularis DAOM 197198w]|uniref:Ste20p n=2 Tax=Rhizophagus irregularis TaxID=588596 RepID=A0A015JZT1_RHIIW|nr:Ste20p [Rhizophagus irregularis DAOM 197198w]